MLHRSASLICATLLVGCVSVPVATIEKAAGSIAVPTKEKLCVSVPKDGEFEGKPYVNSGAKVAEKIKMSIDQRYSILLLNEVTENTFIECVQRGANYIVVPEILAYENRATGWSGQPDKIKVQVDLIEIDSSKKSSFTYYAESDALASAVREWGNAPPYELLGSEFQKQVQDLISGN
jgi:hypothetical protein